MTPKDGIFREIKYALCRDGGLAGLVSPDRVKLDARLSPASDRAGYPWIVFRVTTVESLDLIRHATATVEMTVIGRRADGEELIERVRVALLDHFAGKRKRWGQYAADGTPDPAGGFLMTAAYRDTAEALDQTMREKHCVLLWDFAYLRP